MTDVRIQDLAENTKPDTNDNFALTFTGNSETKTKLRDLYYSLVPDGAENHNTIFRGRNLGNLTATHIANIQNGTFKDMFIGDYFSINNSNYVIAGMNYKRGHGDKGYLNNHLILMPQSWSSTPTQVLSPDNETTRYMNNTSTTEGGFANTQLYKTYLPQIQQKLESDFGSHLMQWRGVVSNHVDNTGAPDQGEWRDMKVMIPNEVMIYGTTLNGNNKDSAFYNVGDDNSQLPLMRLNYAERNLNAGGSIWLRDIHSSTEFAIAGNHGDIGLGSANSTWYGIRAYFLIG